MELISVTAGGYSMGRHLLRMISYGFSHSAKSGLNDGVTLFLSQGEEQERLFRDVYPDKPHLLVGYPRLDGLNECRRRKEAIKQKYGVNDGRPVVLWMPTHNGPETSGIRLYAQKFVDIADRFNVILKPHPDSFFEDPSHRHIRAFLEDGRVKVVRSPKDEAELFAISDLAAVDLGGSLFACLYSKIPVVATDILRGNEASPLDSAIWNCSPHLIPPGQ